MRHLHPLFLSVMYMSLWLSVLVVIQRDHKVKVSLKSLPFASAFLVHPHRARAYCLPFVSMAWTSRLPESSKILQNHRYILLLLLLLFVNMIMNNWFKLGFDIHHWSISYPGSYWCSISPWFLVLWPSQPSWPSQSWFPRKWLKKKHDLYLFQAFPGPILRFQF